MSEDTGARDERKYQEFFASAGVALWAQDFSEVRRFLEEVAGADDLEALFERDPEVLRQAASRIRVDDVNAETLTLFGVENKEQLLGALTKIVLIPESYAALRDQLLAHARGEKRFSTETVVQRLDGTRRHIVLTSIIPPQDETWDRGLISTLDITETKRLEAQLRHAQKMEAVGQLAGGMAHDFNNLLAVIVGRAELLAKVAQDAESKSHVAVIRDTVRQASQMTSRLLAFSRRQALEPEVLDLNTIVGDTVDMLRHLIGESIEIAMRFDRRLDPVCVDAAQIGQLVLNIALNARDAMPRGGSLLIETLNERDEQGTRAVVLRMQDDGDGMDEATQARIFEPFFTTKEDGGGTGLGLATVYGIVEQNGGTISVRSVPGGGATFEVRLPPETSVSADGPSTDPPPVEPPPVAPPPAANVETILLVENDPAVCAVTAELLRDRGFEVLVAEGGEEALEAVAAKGVRVDLLLSDVVMPGMSGPELAERVRALRPDVRVLHMSGYTAAADLGGAPLLPKPFGADALLSAVRSVLDG